MKTQSQDLLRPIETPEDLFKSKDMQNVKIPNKNNL